MSTPLYIVSAVAAALLATPLAAQDKLFELNNPEGITLRETELALLTAHDWRLFAETLINRKNATSGKTYATIRYNADKTFKYRSSSGTWFVQKGKYVVHKFPTEKDVSKTNFGGTFVVTQLNDTLLVLSKLLTSTHDMKRILEFRKTLPPSNPPTFGMLRFPLTPKDLDSISHLSKAALFILNASWRGDTLVINTPDSVYRYKIKKEN